MVQISEENSDITLNIYIIHRSDLNKRDEMMAENKKIYDKLSCNVNITNVEKYIFSDLPKHMEEIQKEVKLEPIGNQTFDNHLQNLHLNHISNYTNHIEALNQIKTHYNASSNKDNQIYLILEDDVLLLQTFETYINNMLKHINEKKIDYDLIFLGFPINTEKIDKEHNANKLNHKIDDIEYKFLNAYLHILSGCDSFFINPNKIDIILKDMRPMRYLTNIQLSYACFNNKLNAYFTFPNLMIEASKISVIPSSINMNNAHIYSEQFMQMVEILNMPKEEFNKDKENLENKFNEIYDKVKQYNNPDNLHLLAIFHNKLEKYETALNIFKEAHKLYNQTHCNINNASNFIQDYTATFKHIQTDIPTNHLDDMD